MGVSKNSATPKWMVIMENPMKMDDLGYHYFWKHPYVSNIPSWMLCFASRCESWHPKHRVFLLEGSGGFTSSTHPRGATKMKSFFCFALSKRSNGKSDDNVNQVFDVMFFVVLKNDRKCRWKMVAPLKFQRCAVPSLNPNSSHLKMGVSFWVPAYFQGRNGC